MIMKELALAVALMACASTASAQTLLFSGDFNTCTTPSQCGWAPVFGPIQASIVNQQLVLAASFSQAFDTNHPLNTFASEGHSLPLSGPLADQQTLEFRVDLVGVNQNDVMTSIHYFDGVSQGYALNKSQNGIAIQEFWNGGQTSAFFFSQPGPLKNTNVTLVVGFTRHSSSLDITARLLDKDNANAVLFEHTVTDTPASDPVLSSSFGVPGVADPVGTPWPISNSAGMLTLGVAWINPTQAPAGPIQATLDNVQVWRYQTPALAIQRAVVLSWPGTTSAFVPVTATNLDGPWGPIPDLWSRTNNGQTQVSVPAQNTQQFFRLLFNP